ncbi:MAG: Lrp/AsnC ligand binding domain-containing protein [Chloroflexi bacterium]|nr:Lrp/AsnC ligand binding domain-containing protein [Chloroflexota bacterium]
MSTGWAAIHGAIVREVLGPYDIVVELEADTPEDLTQVLRSKIRSMQGITSTITCIWV